jgi:cysteinyl-tRNA synthetase
MVKDLLEHYPGEVLRFTILSAHYRSELNFSVDGLDAAKKTLDKLYTALKEVSSIAVDYTVDISETPVYLALLDDLNTPVAIRELHALVKAMKVAEGTEKAHLKSVLLKASSLMGLLQQDVDSWFYVELADNELPDQAVDELVAKMHQARADKDFALADQVRDELQSQGVGLTRDGWKRT